MSLRCLIACFLLSCATCAWAGQTWVDDIAALLQTPDIALLEAKLAVDARLDPGTDGAAVRRGVEAWAAIVRTRTPPDASTRERVDVLLSTLYVAGPWNGHRPFDYDLEDPFARRTESRLLATYLATRRGNCLTMPLLLAVLGDRLDVPLALARAPHHLFVKFRDDDGRWSNIEATSGGFKRDESYVRDTGISQRAIETGLYLRPLTTRQAVATLASDLVDALTRRNDHDAALAMAQSLIDLDPRDADMMVRIGSLYARIVERRFHARWPNPADVPVALHADYRALSAANAGWFAKAEALGWTQPSAASEAAYLESIELERRRRRDVP